MSTRAVQITELLTGLIHPTSGEILDNHTAYFYSAGTSSAKAVWSEKEKTNPYTKYNLSAIGNIQLYAEGNYKIVIREYSADDDGTIIYTWNNLRFEHPNYYVHAISANHTQLSEDDFLLVDTTADDVTIALLAAASWTHVLKVRRTAGSNDIIIDPNGDETIDSAATLTINSDAIVELYSDGSNIKTAGFRSSFVSPDGTTQITVEDAEIGFDIAGDTDVVTIDADGLTADEVDTTAFKIGGTAVTANAVEINYACDSTSTYEYTATNSGGKTLTGADTDIASISCGTGAVGDVLFVSYNAIVAKGGTGGNTSLSLWQNGSATGVAKFAGLTSYKTSINAAASTTYTLAYTVVLVVTTAGTIILDFKGSSAGSDSTIGDGLADLTAVYLKKQAVDP